MTFANKLRRGLRQKLSAKGARPFVQIVYNNLRITLKALSTLFKLRKKRNYYIIAIILKSFRKKQALITQKAFLNSFA